MSSKFAIATFVTLFAANLCAETLTEDASDAAGVQAETEITEEQTSLGGLDRDQDGKISRSESYGNMHIPSQFDELDADQDGSLDQSEFSQFETSSPTANDSGQAVDEAPEDAVQEQSEEVVTE